MPGFKIDGKGDGPDATAEVYRAHRFELKTFLGKPGNKAPWNTLKDADLPDKALEELQIKTIGATYRFAKQISYSDLKLTFYTPSKLIPEIEELFDKAHDTDEGLKDFDKYVGEIVLQLYSGEETIDYTFKNAFISNITNGQLSYGSSDLKLITVTIKFSWYETAGG
jgi:hypothetical protein